MKEKIYCKPTARGTHSLYLTKDGEEYLLFSQKYRKSVQAHFGKGIVLQDALKYSNTHQDEAIIRTVSKLPPYLKYIEKEYDLEILNKTKKNNKKINKKVCCEYEADCA